MIQWLTTAPNPRCPATGFDAGQRDGIDAFTALQGITRYVDHDRDSGDVESRLFGSGAALKDKALGLLIPRIADKVPVPA